jgi:hypothetical protein
VAGCKDGADIHGGRGLEEEDEFLPSAGASTVGKRRRVEERVRFLFFYGARFYGRDRLLHGTGSQ